MKLKEFTEIADKFLITATIYAILFVFVCFGINLILMPGRYKETTDHLIGVVYSFDKKIESIEERLDLLSENEEHEGKFLNVY